MSWPIAVVDGVPSIVLGILALVALVLGLVDILRLPSWAWGMAGRSRALAAMLVVAVPILGAIFYVFALREPVASVAVKGRAANVPLEGVSARPAPGSPRVRLHGTISPPVSFGSFGPSPPMAPNPFGEASPPLVVARRGSEMHGHLGVSPGTTTDRTNAPVLTAPAPVAPPGWNSDPTGRHQFRYWDGYTWTERVADAGTQSSDPISS